MYGSSEKAALLFLLITSTLLPVLYEYFLQQQERKKKRNISAIEESLVSVAEMALQVRRQLDNQEMEGGGDRRKRRRRSHFRHERAEQAVYEDYFAPTPIFNDRQFERIYRVSKSIVQQLFDICARTDPFFTAQRDVSGRFNIGPLVKVLMALKLIGFGCSPSAFQDYFQMSVTTARLCLLKFCRIISTDESLRSVFARVMTRADARRVCAIHEENHGVAGMIGSLDCMHVFWKNCPVAWQGSQTGKAGKPTIVLEAFADHNLWFWHHSFGWPGSLNDINIWNRSCLLKAFLDGSFAANVDFEYAIGDKVFQRLWLAVDGIYPELSRFVKTIEEPVNRKSIVFAKWQEATRKDIERAFGVLQRKFQVLVRKIELWYVGDIGALVNTAIILHNMMVAQRIDNDETECESF
ncbi:Ribosomal protein-like protein [Fragilaria crotonensis]|nr:Ribosomal protein-like protein [Fragilaria crotonensis]